MKISEEAAGVSKVSGNQKKSNEVVRNTATGFFVSSASAAYKYYASNTVARKAAVGRFESRVGQSVAKTATKKAKRSA